MNWIFALQMFIFIAVSGGEKLEFHNYSVYSITPMNTASLKILKDWEELRYNDFNFWSPVTAVNNSVDIMVPPHLKDFVERTANTMGMSSNIFMENVQEHIDKEKGGPALRSGSFGWTNYHTLDQIHAWIQELPQRYPGVVTLIQAGESYEKRRILGVKVTFKNVPQKTVFLEANIHAREWITSATATYILNELLTSNDTRVRSIADSYDWYIFPVTNPDGFVYTQINRMWRKTRTPHGICSGVDPNRNWGYRWNDGGSSSFSCSETYHGPRPFSEPSTLALAQYISKVAETEDLIAYISFHSYSQMLLLPYGHTKDHLDNYNEMFEVGQKARDALARRYGTEYVVGNTAEIIYVATGCSGDWVKANFKTPIVFTYELRDKGQSGFILPPDQIIPTGEETLDSLLTILEEGKRYL